MKIIKRIQNSESRSQNFNQSLLTSAATGALFLILSLVISTPAKAASVQISLQTCGISPAANRNLVLTPLQAEGSGAIPVMDKIQTNTDLNGNVSVTLMPGVYQADVRPAWGQVGLTEFCFYVDPSNAMQNAFANLLTATNNTYPPSQYAYSAQASDARYALVPVTSNNVASINPAQIYPPIPNAVTNNQTGVTLGGTFNGSFNGNGVGLTNVNAASLGNLTSVGYIQNLNEGLGLWLNAKQTLISNPALSDGQYVQVKDLSGAARIILTNANSANPVTFSSSGINGLPAFYFDLSELEVSNFWIGVTNSFTIAITFRDLNGTNNNINYIVQAGGWGQNFPYSFRLTTWEDAALDSQSTGGAMGFFGFVSDGFPSSCGVQQAQYLAHVFTLSFDGTNVWATLDGKPTMDSRLQTSTSSAGLLANATNLYIGGQIAGGENFFGYISDLRVYTNVCSGPFQAALENYLCQDARIPINSLDFIGDSIQEGLRTTAILGGLQQILNPLLPSFLFNTEAFSGRTSSEELTNLLAWTSSRSVGVNLADIYVGVNDFSGNQSGTQQFNQVPVTLANLTNMVIALESNNIQVCIGTIMSVYWETNSIVSLGYDWRSNLNNGIRGLTNLGAFVVDYAADIPSMGTNGAYANVNNFNTDEVHPNANGYTNMAIVSVPVLKGMIGNYNSNSPTNVPPFSIVAPLMNIWSGHFYYNSNGIWVLIH